MEKPSEYWHRTLADAPAVLELPTNHRRPAKQDHAGAFVPLELDEDLTAELKALSRCHGTTLFTTLLAGWGALLAKLSGQDDVVIGVPIANRSPEEVEPLIGFFVNTLALRLDLSGSPSIGELLHRVKARALEAQQHQDLFDQLLPSARSPAHTPVFQVAFAWRNSGESLLNMPGLTVAPAEVSSISAKFDLTLSLAEADGRITGGLEYATPLLDRATVERHAGYLRRLLEGMVADDMQPVDRLPLLGEAERHQLLVEWNATAADCSRDQCVHELFEAQAARMPDAIAVVHESAQLTYAELNARSNRLAHHLRTLGVKPDALVAVCVERSLDMVVGLLAILKAGGAYVPLDPAYPAERLAYMLEDSRPVAVLMDTEARGRLAAACGGAVAALTVDLDADSETWAGQPDSNPNRTNVDLTSRHLAYVIYTSGSTGRPKGVMVEHANVTRLFAATGAWFRFGVDDVWTLFHSYAFDFSVWEMWGALLHGGRLVIVPQAVARSPRDFYRLVCEEGVTVLNQTPSSFQHLIAAQAESATAHRLRYVIFGGEKLETATLRPWYQLNEHKATQLINMYGITETTVHVTYRLLGSADADRGGSPIGCRIPDLRLFILDPHGEPVPIGVAGEIYVGGAGVARGYLNRPELTAERFLPDPFAGEAEARMYRTGDLARYLPDGNIEFLGRNDFQVKIRGFRIELGEIEARLLQHPGVRNAVVLAREDVVGDKRLVAYYTRAAGAEAVDAEALRRHLSAILPDYMVPAAYVRLDALPLTTNGKLDRKALPAPRKEAYVARGYEAPVGEIEMHLARIWADVLMVARVGRKDNFFELGGHSLMALRLSTQVERTLGFKIDLAALFKAPTLQEFAEWLSRRDRASEPWQIVEVQPRGEKTPIIAIDNAMLYHGLARKIAQNRRFIGVQLFDPTNPQPLPCRSLNEIAADYVRLIRKAQPHGPYILLGLCVAGLIAYEVAQQLRREGEAVPLVIMADTEVPGDSKPLSFGQRFISNWSFRLRALKHQFRLLRRGQVRLAEILATYRLVRKSRILDLAVALHFVDSSMLNWGNHWYYPGLVAARDSYRISSSCGDVVLFQSDTIDTRFTSRNMGWSNFIKGRLSFFRLPGWHGLIFMECVDLIAGYLRPLLDQVDAEQDRPVVQDIVGIDS